MPIEEKVASGIFSFHRTLEKPILRGCFYKIIKFLLYFEEYFGNYV